MSSRRGDSEVCVRRGDGTATPEPLTRSRRVEDEVDFLRGSIERYRRLLREVSDERLARELKRMIEEAEQRLKEIEGRS